MILRISYKDHVTNEEVREKTQWTVGPYGDLTIVKRRKLQACPFPDVVFPPLPLSALSSSPFRCALQDSFGQT